MMKEEMFNKWFNAAILLGMSVALIATTAIKINTASTAGSLIIISAIGSLMGILATVCSANGRIVTFLFGLIDVSIYGVMCLLNWKNGYSGLGNAVLHFLYFVPMQFVGYFTWKKKGNTRREGFRAKRLDGKGWMIVTTVFILGSLLSYAVIARFDKSAADSFLKMAVVLDVLPLMCNIMGQFLMSTAYMEQWIFWIGVNVFSIVMWSMTYADNPESFALIYIVKYSFYLINSFNGLRIWIRMSKPDTIA